MQRRQCVFNNSNLITMARQVVINIDDDAWNECDIAAELREVALAIEHSGSHGGITYLGNTWSIEENEL